MNSQNIVGKYAKRTVFKNRGRTILTMFGIIIATAMFAVVLSARTSCVDILKSFQDDDYGTWHIQAYSMTSRDYQKVMKDERIKRSAYIQEAGYLKGSSDMSEEDVQELLSYENFDIFIASVSSDFEDLCNMKVVWGRMPENENEAIISLEMYADYRDEVYDNSTAVYFEIPYYSRYSEGHKVNDLKTIHHDKNGKATESLYKIDTLEFQVVGYFVVPEYATWKNLSRYTVLLGPSKGSNLTAGNAVNAYFELNDPSDYVQFAKDYFESEDDCLYNKDYIRMKDSADDTRTIRWLDILAVSALVIILLLAVMLIYNSFSTSSMERIRAIGLLKSVGATKRQVRELMIAEAFYYIIIAIPIGILVGNLSAIVLFYKLGSIVKEAGFFLLSQTVDLRYRLSIENTLFPAILSVITIFVAILIPMVRTSNITPIEAVRVNNVFTTKPLRKRSRGLAVRLLGFTGALSLKNFFRYRKRYRAPILSLMLSILMIFSTHLLVRAITSQFSTGNSDDADLLTYSYYYGENSFDESDRTLYYQLAGMEQVKDSLIILQTRKDVVVEDAVMTSDYLSRMDKGEDENISAALVFVEDSAFRKLCTDNGIDPDPYMTYGSRNCLTNNHVEVDEDGKYDKVKVFSNAVFPLHVRLDFTEGTGITAKKKLIDINLSEEIPDPFLDSQSGAAAQLLIYMPLSRMSYYSASYKGVYEYFMFRVNDPESAYSAMKKELENNLHSGENLHDAGAYTRARDAISSLAQVLIYGYAALLCLICFLNVIMTLLTSILFRRKEYILLTSVGMSRKTLFRMVITESMICFLESLLLLAVVLAVLIFVVTTFLNISVYSKKNLLFAAITVFVHLLMVTSTAAFGLRHVMSENVIEGIRKDYY